jgi:putative transposase
MRALSRENVDLRLIVELLQSKIDRLEASRPVTYADAWRYAELYSIRLHRRYTLARVCRAWGFSRATVYRQRQRVARSSHHPVSIDVLDDANIASRLNEIVANSPFPAERHRKLWARLKRAGVEVSRERVRRIVREFAVIPAVGAGIITKHPDIMWGIDAAKVGTAEDGPAFVLFAIDHYTAECLAIRVVQEETTQAWLSVVLDALRHAFQNVAPGCAAGLKLRHDNLPLYRSAAFRRPLRIYGIGFSPSPILSPQMNGCAERFVRTLRDNLLSIRFFNDISELTEAVRDFRLAYNGQWLLARENYRTPAELRAAIRDLGDRSTE